MKQNYNFLPTEASSCWDFFDSSTSYSFEGSPVITVVLLETESKAET